ncbi:TonB-linked outer membrane protein, SusC/RagA family [Chitinophaga terrae (ex Kim and Jung 2007)]|uniref:TonB-linked outer membrane protein, SusC/RagA family n=1 Tax=Chitinophaga terrae (ex Kim and Jung 2007) TaxID=408074 RepID=A0A1H4GA76_9BACT|nr:TonB-dependent receptor [Chitinophaga terrae (ex Kim and Jung 2007)]GEP93245.1 SusC/RagA family TonB-linked outer membrane protein [Chitinophaga terrae (ex Kim and Jung 2007)]SEB06454.1 TonB-linked outer membrane protein, SusC/RagA family [Chitinophaga terrae (ex Kim and Jung 2007)]
MYERIASRMQWLLTIIVMMIGAIPALAQSGKITGTVTDLKGEPIPGVSILISGTKTGTITDATGAFSLNTNVANGTVEVSFLGFEPQTVPFRNGGTLTIKMKQAATDVDEVVVVGARMKKSDLTGAVGNVDAKALMQRPSTNINQALQGNAAGVFVSAPAKPSDDASIRVRGINTINAGSSPIYVVDGVIMENNQGGFNSINPNDVASIQVLKDASATALYGSRGANGVIVVTTKKGQRRGGDGLVTYDSWVGISNFTRIPKTMNAQELFDLRVDAYANGYMKDNPTANRQAYIDTVLLKKNIAFSNQEFDTHNKNKSFNWLDQVTHTGFQQNHALGFSGGGEKGVFYLSVGYAGLNGIVQTTKQDKYTGRFNAEYNVKKWLKVGTNTGFTRTKDLMPSDDVYDKAIRANPLLDYAPYKDPATRFTYDYLTTYFRAHGEQNNNDFNPFNSQLVQRDRSRNRITSSNYININPIEGLDIRSTYSLDYGNQEWFEFTPHNIQQAIRHNNGDARAKHERWSDTYWQWDNTITYNRTFAQDHKLTVLAGTSVSKRSSNYTLAQGDRFVSDQLGYYDLGSSAALDKRVIGSDFYAYTLSSFIARANYSFKDRYHLTATARYDGSSRFMEGSRWGLFPSVSAAWDVKKESFMEDVNVFSQLKLRAGYGVVGNQDIGNYVYQTLYGASAVNNTPVIGNDGRRGGDLTWERQKQSNLGLDMSFLKSRLNVTADFFYINNDNLLLDRSLAITSGYSKRWANIGRVNNKGMEISVSADVIQKKDFNWNVSGNISFDKNTVKNLYGNITSIYNTNENVIQREGNIFLGESIHTIYTLRSGGIAQEWNRKDWEGLNYNGKTVAIGDLFARDVSGPDGKPDGIVNQYDLTIVGKSDPKFYGGFSTNLAYKAFALNALFTYSYGAKKISNYYESLLNSNGESMATTDLLNRWTPQNTNTNIPRVITNTSYNRYNPSDLDFAIQDASFLRLAAVTLSYNLPEKVLSAWKFNNVRLYVTGSNLFCITKYKGMDPETGDWGYPPVKQYVFGLNVGF